MHTHTHTQKKRCGRDEEGRKDRGLARKTGAVLGLVLAQKGPAGQKGLRLSQATSSSPDFLGGHSASPSVPFVADPKLTNGLGDVPGSPGDCAASAILGLLLRGRTHSSLRNLKRGGARPVSASERCGRVTGWRLQTAGGRPYAVPGS